MNRKLLIIIIAFVIFAGAYLVYQYLDRSHLLPWRRKEIPEEQTQKELSKENILKNLSQNQEQTSSEKKEALENLSNTGEQIYNPQQDPEISKQHEEILKSLKK